MVKLTRILSFPVVGRFADANLPVNDLGRDAKILKYKPLYFPKEEMESFNHIAGAFMRRFNSGDHEKVAVLRGNERVFIENNKKSTSVPNGGFSVNTREETDARIALNGDILEQDKIFAMENPGLREAFKNRHRKVMGVLRELLGTPKEKLTVTIMKSKSIDTLI